MASSRNVDNFRVDLRKPLGEGTFGLVYMATDRRNGNRVAAKLVNLSGEKEHEQFSLNEVLAHQAAKDHPNLVRMIHHKLDRKKKELWLFTEYCHHGNLEEFVKKNPLDLETVLKIMHDCSCGLDFMNNRMDGNVIHRDVKPGNILLTTENGQLVAKLADFGLAKVLSPFERNTRTGLGTLLFMAPEFFKGTVIYNKTIDTFALGIVLLQLLMVLLTGKRDMNDKQGKSIVNVP